MNELKPCPFCGWNNGTHRKDCYMLLLGRNIDAVIDGEIPPISVEMLDKAWNTRYEPMEESSCRLIVFQDSEISYIGGMHDSEVTEAVGIAECENCGRMVLIPPTTLYCGYEEGFPFDNESLWAVTNYCPHCRVKVAKQ